MNSSIGPTQGSANLNLLAKDLDAGLALFFDMLRRPGFQEDRLKLAKSQILQAMERRNDRTDVIEDREWTRLVRGTEHFTAKDATKASIEAITREDLTMSIAAVVTVIGAPLSEELFFRGFVFSGLLRWGFWPAAAASALLFALVHFDPGSLLPFFSIGLLMAWLYWRRGSLWDAIVFHFLFNALSFSILVAIS